MKYRSIIAALAAGVMSRATAPQVRTKTLSISRFACVALAALVAACSGASGLTNPGSGAAFAGAAGRLAGVQSQITSPVLYVLNETDYQASISVFSGPKTSFLRSLQIGEFADQQFEITTDTQGDFYVGGVSDNKAALYVYADGAARVAHIITQRKVFLWVTLGSQNNIYTACAFSRLCEYAAVDKSDNAKLIRSIGLKALHAQSGPMAVDGGGNLALSNTYYIYIFARNAEKPDLKISTGGNYAPSMAYDSQGNLYAATYKGIVVYAPGSKTPSRTITNGFADASALAFDAQDNLFVLNACGTQCGSTTNSICVFAPGASTPNRTITKGLDNSLAGMAVTSSGVVYASNKDGSLVVYPAGATKPQKTIKNNLSSPTKLVVSS